MYRVLRPFIKDGFERGDKALHIVNPKLRDDHLRRLADAGISVAETMGNGQLEVWEWYEGPLYRDRFDKNVWLQSFETGLKSGHAAGYKQIRFLADMEWALVDLPGVSDLIEFETLVNYATAKYDDAVICAYDLSKFSAGVALDALRTHPVVIMGGLVQESPFFVPPDQFLRELRERRSGTASSAGVLRDDATEPKRFAEEQAALRRVATLVARGAPPEELFAAVTADVGHLLEADFTVIGRYDPDGTVTVVGSWSTTGAAVPFPVGVRLEPGGRNLHTLVSRTGRPVRLDNYDEASDSGADIAPAWGLRSAVGTPIGVEDRLWGFIGTLSSRKEPLPADTEARLAGFTELVATAIANAEARAALTTSRARIMAATDNTRRRIERDLHDGAQQRLVSLALQLHAVQGALPAEAPELARQLGQVTDGLTGVLEELRELAFGIHPAALALGGLRPALKALARRCPLPVRIDVGVEGRMPEPLELAAYYVVAEALTNAAKHAQATVVDVVVTAAARDLHVSVHDDGCGGVDLNRGSGLIGLTDRVVAFGGRIGLHSPPGAGTTLEISLPRNDPGLAEQ
jgi:signal transduction histidine kinase